MPSLRTDEEWQMFIDELRRTGLKMVSARYAGIPYSTITKRLTADEQFADAVAEAIAESAELLEAEARRRAYDGVEREKVIGSGDSARHIVEVHYSDQLMVKLLEANNPDKFKTRTSNEISGPDGKPIELNSTESAARISAILEGAKQRRDAKNDEVDPFA